MMPSLLSQLVGNSGQGIKIANLDTEYQNSEYSMFSRAGGREEYTGDKTRYHVPDKSLVSDEYRGKALPLDHFTDGKQSVSRIALPGGKNAYFVQIRAGIIKNFLDEKTKKFVNRPQEIRSLNAIICVGGATESDKLFETPNDVKNFCSGQSRNSIIHIPIMTSVQDVVNMLRSDLEERLIADWYQKLPGWSIIIDGGIQTRKIKSHIGEPEDVPFSKGMVGLVKTSKMNYLNPKTIEQVYGLKYRERSAIFEATAMEKEGMSEAPVWSSFFKLRPERAGNPLWGTVMLNMTAIPQISKTDPNFATHLDRSFGNIALHILDRAYGIANDQRWDRELRPTSELEKYMAATILGQSVIVQRLASGDIS